CGEELLDATGELRAGGSGGSRLAGVPRYVYAELFRAVWRAATVKGNSAQRLRCAYHARYLRAYIGRTIRRRLADMPERARMSLRRFVFVHALLAVLVGGSRYDIRTGLEHWPLSPYPMFSFVEGGPSLPRLP